VNILKAEIQKLAIRNRPTLLTLEKYLKVLGTLNSVIYIYDKVIMFSVPIRNHIVVISADRNIEIDTVFKQVQSFIKDSEAELDFELGVKNISQEKRESVRNLYDSGISEEMIAEQVDLNLATVKSLIKIITTNSK
jgi:hypothetical protein